MAVQAQQWNDDEWAGEYEIAPTAPQQPDRALLAVKRASHSSKGWSVEDLVPGEPERGFVATKVYPDVPPEAIGKKRRVFRVV